MVDYLSFRIQKLFLVSEIYTKKIYVQLLLFDVITTLKMARKPVKLQKENPTGCTGGLIVGGLLSGWLLFGGF